MHLLVQHWGAWTPLWRPQDQGNEPTPPVGHRPLEPPRACILSSQSTPPHVCHWSRIDWEHRGIARAGQGRLEVTPFCRRLGLGIPLPWVPNPGQAAEYHGASTAHIIEESYYLHFKLLWGLCGLCGMSGRRVATELVSNQHLSPLL